MRIPIALLCAAVVGAARAQAGANAPVEQLDIARYSGTWHEIAHLPMFWQRKCASDITATYTRRDDGGIDVRNACRTAAGEEQVSTGRAKPVPGSPGALKVTFAPRIVSWLAFTWADYWVIDLDNDYQWAVVGSPSRKYLWILSREPSMSRSRFEELRARARARGYRVDRLVVAAPLR